ncbi:MAG: glutaredoxin 3 [Alphaproteobacteria bacterium]|jgi:glutaredoxin 3
MNEIIIYSKDYCPYCTKAKRLFESKGISNFKEVDITYEEKLQQEMFFRSGGRKTVPQIFINGQHIGGCDDLYALDKLGKLNKLLDID